MAFLETRPFECPSNILTFRYSEEREKIGTAKPLLGMLHMFDPFHNFAACVT